MLQVTIGEELAKKHGLNDALINVSADLGIHKLHPRNFCQTR